MATFQQINLNMNFIYIPAIEKVGFLKSSGVLKRDQLFQYSRKVPAEMGGAIMFCQMRGNLTFVNLMMVISSTV